jgi:Bacteriophage probable baseplate hub protein
MPELESIRQLAPDFRILINGSDPPPKLAADVMSIHVDEDIDAPSMFTFRLINWDMQHLKVTWSDDDLLREGSEVEIKMGYVDNLETLMVGEITGLEPEFCADELPILTVRGYDRRHRLMRNRKSQSYTQVKDSDIADQIASAVGLTPEVEDTGVTYEYVFQRNQTDLAFLQQRAQRIGYEVVVDNRTLYFRPQQHIQTETLTVTQEGGLTEFYPYLSTLRQVGRYEVRGWDPKEKKEIVGTAGIGDEVTSMGGETTGPATSDDAFGESTRFSVEWPVSSQAEADQMAAGQFNETALAYIMGEGTCVGRVDLRAGSVIKIEGLGRRFSGLYYITSTIHKLNTQGGYRTSFRFRRNAT